MNEKLVKKMFVSMLAVNIFGFIVALIGTVIDGIIISRFYGSAGMAGCGLVSPIFIICTAIGGILSAGLQTTVGKSMSCGDRDEANRFFSVAFYISLFFAVVLTGIILGFTPEIVSFLGGQPGTEMYDCACEYLFTLGFAMPIVILMGPIQPLIALSGNKQLIYIGIMAMTIVNIAGDFLNVFLFHGGMFGMALATVISYLIAFCIMVFAFFKNSSYFKLVSCKGNIGKSADILKNGVPTATLRISNTLRIMVINAILIAVGGQIVVSAFSIMMNIASIFTAISMGGGAVVLMVGSVIIGEEDKESLKNLLNISSKIIFFASLIASAIMFAFAPIFVGIYAGNGTDEVEISVTAVRYFALSLPIYGLNLIWTNYLQASKHLVLATIGSIMDNFGFVVLFALILSKPFGEVGVWVAFPLCEVAVFAMLYLTSCFINKKIIKNIDDLMLLPPDFGYPDDDKMEKSIATMDEVVELSKKSLDFCLEHGIDRKKSSNIALVVEEMAGNIIEHGFDDGKHHSIDFIIAIKRDELITMRLRDDCRRFDPTEQVEIYHSEDPTHHIGIRLCYHMMDDISYTNVINMNNLRIKMRLDN